MNVIVQLRAGEPKYELYKRDILEYKVVTERARKLLIKAQNFYKKFCKPVNGTIDKDNSNMNTNELEQISVGLYNLLCNALKKDSTVLDLKELESIMNTEYELDGKPISFKDFTLFNKAHNISQPQLLFVSIYDGNTYDDIFHAKLNFSNDDNCDFEVIKL